ncbi:MAG: ATP-dependent sacrificial sulfur transferase LarE [Elusimicrobia bacterium]|nr:ATP-dependent sacrificial sulfur transferase LarE [Elusimicrobiota bacterium]
MKIRKNLSDKKNRLERIMGKMKGVLVAFSGGVDSMLLLKTAHDMLEDRAAAFTAVSPVHPPDETDRARAFTAEHGIKHIIMDVNVTRDGNFVRNTPARCYWCKKKMYSAMMQAARAAGLECIADGTNTDDRDDYRPGMKAAAVYAVRHPLMEAGMGKEDIRELSRLSGLKGFDRQSYSCLATRVPYGERITLKKLGMIRSAEESLRKAGIRTVRVRHCRGDSARIETDISQIAEITGGEMREIVLENIKRAGYKYVSVDMEGFRSGSMNEVLKKKRRDMKRGGGRA